jgi:hypothetical protein
MAQPSPLYSLTGAAKIAVESGVADVINIRLNTNGWNENPAAKEVSRKLGRAARGRPTKPVGGRG